MISHRTKGVRHLLAAWDMNTDRLYGHNQDHGEPHQALGALPLPAQRQPQPARGAHRHRHGQLQSAPVDQEDNRVSNWAAANNVELPYVPTNARFLNRIECHFTALRYFALNGTDHQTHESRTP